MVYVGENHKIRGSMTVELTLLMPLILAVFLFLFFTLYYLHDVVAVNKGISTALLRGGLAGEDGSAVGIMTEAVSDIRLLGKWDIGVICNEDADEVRVSVEGEMVPGKYFYETSGTNRRINEVKYLREHRTSRK